MNLPVEPSPVMTDTVESWGLAALFVCILCAVVLVVVRENVTLSDRAVRRCTVGGACFLAAGVIVGVALLIPPKHLPGTFTEEQPMATVDQSVPVIEQHYGVTVLEAPDSHDTGPVLGEYLLLDADRTMQSCELRIVGAATVDGQEAVLLCNGTELDPVGSP